jgi:heat shock protein HtpX
MTTVMFLLGALFVALVVGLAYAAGGGLGILIGIGGIGFAVYQWANSDKVAMRAMRAREVTPEQAPELHGVIDRLCALADMPKPRVGVADTQVPNAFATGRSPQRSVVCVTTGILDLLTAEELEGVLAHELSHVKNRDVLIATIAAAVAGLVSALGHAIQWGAILGGFGGRSDDEDGGGNVVAALAWALLAPLIALVVQLAVSRSREFAADASGATLTGDPDALAEALLALEQVNQAHPYRFGGPATAHLFIVNPFRGAGGKMLQLFSTHPPIEERVRRLKELRRGMRFA